VTHLVIEVFVTHSRSLVVRAMKILRLIDELLALELADIEASLRLMEGFLLVELVAVGCPDHVRVQVLLRHEKLPVTDRRVLRETRRVVEFVLFVRGNGTHVKTDAA
jgi:hypothetical protein